MMQKLLKRLSDYANADCCNTGNYLILSRLVGIVYLVATAPLYFQIVALIGHNGLIPADDLLNKAWNNEGLLAIVHYPSLYWLFKSNYTLLALVITGCIGGIGLALNYKPLASAVVAWLSFTSLCVIGSDFLVIIIDLFLSEVGFLLILVHLSIRLYGYVSGIIDFLFRLLNFRLWFSMGMVKFYFPGTTWIDGSFFANFFQFQPMPTPLAYYFEKLPHWTFVTAEIWVAISQLIIPFFVFGGKLLRKVAFAAFLVTSVLIMLTGNYGYFNILSIVVAIAVLPAGKNTMQNTTPINIKPIALNTISCVLLFMQFCYTGALFDPKPPGYQNHFNTIFLYPSINKGAFKFISAPLKPFVYARACNPYGVFKSIPRFRIELRFYGSYDSINWQAYEFKYVPSGNTQYLKYFAPYYPRLDHVLFYETLDAGGYNFNLLNTYGNRNNVWTGRLIEKLFSNDNDLTLLLHKNPFTRQAPLYIKCDAYSLKFDPEGGLKHPWQEVFLKTVFSGNSSQITYNPLLESKYIYSVMQL